MSYTKYSAPCWENNTFHALCARCLFCEYSMLGENVRNVRFGATCFFATALLPYKRSSGRTFSSPYQPKQFKDHIDRALCPCAHARRPDVDLHASAWTTDKHDITVTNQRKMTPCLSAVCACAPARCGPPCVCMDHGQA